MTRKPAAITHESETGRVAAAIMDRYAAIVETFTQQAGVTFGSPGQNGFGSSALKINGKIFAMINSKGRFVVKLPRQRVEALIAAGQGERYDPGHGRLMKEWLVVEPTSEAEWIALAREAIAFVAAKT